MSRKKIGTVWFAGCSGCHMSLLDLDERLLEVAKLADIVKSPVVDGKEFPEVDVAVIEGAIGADEHLEELRLIRRKAKVLVALGDCAVTGNVSALRNWIPKDDVLKHAYMDLPSNEKGKIPQDTDLCRLLERARPLHEFVKIDYYLPGCPPSADLIYYVLSEILQDRVPVLGKGKLKYG